MKLYIEGRRDGYSTDQISRTMTVAELMNFLEQFDEDAEIYLRNDNGYTYGSVTESSFREAYEDDEEE